MVENGSQPPDSGAKGIQELNEKERIEYLKVKGWRIWTWSIFGNRNYHEALKKVRENPKALIVSIYDGGLYDFLDEKTIGGVMPFKYGSFDVASYVLDPLSDEEVNRIDESGEAPGPLGSVDRPEELLRPHELDKFLRDE